MGGEELVHLHVGAALDGGPFATVIRQRPYPDMFEAPVLLHIRRVRACPLTMLLQTDRPCTVSQYPIYRPTFPSADRA